jgi:hypothetical protein
MPKNEPAEEFLQVYMVHDVVIERFKQWVDEQGWELVAIPRFADDAEGTIETHIIRPKRWY